MEPTRETISMTMPTIAMIPTNADTNMMASSCPLERLEQFIFGVPSKFPCPFPLFLQPLPTVAALAGLAS